MFHGRPAHHHRSRTVVAAAMCALLLSACSDDDAVSASQRQAQAMRSVEPPTVALALARLPEFSQFRAMLRRAGVAPLLADPVQRVTVLAPRDTAFARMAPEARAPLISGTTAQTLRGFVVPRLLSADELRTRIIAGGGSYATQSLAGTTLTFSMAGDQLLVASATGGRGTIGTAGIVTGNGAIYVLDRWIGPGSPS